MSLVDGRDRQAYAAWSAMAEPGDPEAGALVRALGAAEAMAWVREGCEDLARAAAKLHGRMERDDAVRMVNAHERWARRWDSAQEPWEKRAHQIGARLVVPGDDEWPDVIDDLGSGAPHALWVRGSGHLGRLLTHGIALVGARAATSYGEYVATGLAAGVADAGWTVISGGAYGIDGAAHRAALASDAPTVAVMAGGVDRLYPAGHDVLLHAVMDVGCVVSEVPVGFAPHRSRFLQRNRLIAASAVTVVVEAGVRSGALNTARHASDLLRPVAAVPGSVESASSAGCHHLVREGGAVLVTCAQDVLELAEPVGSVSGSRVSRLWGEKVGPTLFSAPEFETPAHRAVYDVLSARPQDTGRIASRAGLNERDARSALGGLALQGLAEHQAGGWRRGGGHKA